MSDNEYISKEKQQALQSLKDLAKSKTMSENEVKHAYDSYENLKANYQKENRKSLHLKAIFYLSLIGGGLSTYISRKMQFKLKRSLYNGVFGFFGFYAILLKIDIDRKFRDNHNQENLKFDKEFAQVHQEESKKAEKDRQRI